MRSAKVKDFWRSAYKRDYKNGITKINLNGLNNLTEIEFSKGPIAFCGLNGSGKSTIISAIKDIVGLNLSGHDIRRIGEHIIEGTASINNQEIICKNSEAERLFDKGMETSSIKYIDCLFSISAQDYMIKQTNLEELLDQYEECKCSIEELNEINYLIGKSYDSCSIYEIEDIDDTDQSFPFFQVETDDLMYDTRRMGSGEHFLLCLFWCIKRMEKDTILIVEEPETYISILSQMHFADYIGKIMSENGIRVILTTHSPYILKNIKNENIKILSRMGNEVSVLVPDSEFTIESALGISQSYLGTLFVEDKVAADLLTVILEDKAPWILRQYAIDIVGGESQISERLQFPKDPCIHYDFIGVYDGDMRTRLHDNNKLNWGYCFLPGDQAPEEVFRRYIRQPGNLDKLCVTLGKNKEKVIAFLATIEGFDCHDWFLDFRTHLNINGRILMSAFYNSVMYEEPIVDNFIQELQKAIGDNQ